MDAYTGRITCQESVIKLFLYERLRSAYIILRNNGTGVPARWLFNSKVDPYLSSLSISVFGL